MTQYRIGEVVDEDPKTTAINKLKNEPKIVEDDTILFTANHGQKQETFYVVKDDENPDSVRGLTVSVVNLKNPHYNGGKQTKKRKTKRRKTKRRKTGKKN